MDEERNDVTIEPEAEGGGPESAERQEEIKEEQEKVEN